MDNKTPVIPNSKYQRAQDGYLRKMESLVNGDETARVIAEALKNGKNTYMKMSRLESSSYDTAWIDAIENCLYELGQIVKDPKKSTKVVTDVVAVELARKTGAESVRHLASHSEFVKEVDPYGNVIPKKILNIGAEDDYAIYENRFIATLIRRLVIFIEKRYDFVTKIAELKNVQGLYFKNASNVDGMDVEMETKIRLINSNDSDEAQKSTAYVERIKNMRNYIRFYYSSDFMRIMKTEKDVRNPIIQTNILRKNPLYKKCYQLYRFIETYDKLGVNYKVKETYHDFSQDDIDDLNLTVLGNFLATKCVAPLSGVTSEKIYKPKILHGIDDEMFEFGDLYSGPIEFARIDGKYIDYLKTTKWVPDHPTKMEKEYYKDEIQEKRAAKEREKAQLDFIARKKKEQEDWEKRVAESIASRKKDEEETIALESARIRAEELKKLEDARRKLEIEARKEALLKLKEEEERAEAEAEIEQDKIQKQIDEARERARNARDSREEILALLKAAQAAALEEEKKAEEAERDVLQDASEKGASYDDQLIKSILRRQIAEKALTEAERKILGKAGEEDKPLSEEELRVAISEALKGMGGALGAIHAANGGSATGTATATGTTEGTAASGTSGTNNVDVHNEENSLREQESVLDQMSEWDARRIREEAEMRRSASSLMNGEQESAFQGTAPESYDAYANPYQYDDYQGLMGGNFTMDENGGVTPDHEVREEPVKKAEAPKEPEEEVSEPVTGSLVSEKAEESKSEEVRPLTRDEARRLQLIEARIRARRLQEDKKNNPEEYLKEVNKRIAERDRAWKERETELAYNAMELHVAKGNAGDGKYIISCTRGFVAGNRKFTKTEAKALVLHDLTVAENVAKAINGDIIRLD